MGTRENDNNFKNSKKNGNANDNFLIFCGFCLIVIWIVLLCYTEHFTIDRIVNDGAKFIGILGSYFIANILLETILLQNDEPINNFRKVFYFIIIIGLCFFLSEILSRNFSKMVEYFTMMVFPAFYGAFKSISKNAVMNLKDRKQKRLENEINKKRFPSLHDD